MHPAKTQISLIICTLWTSLHCPTAKAWNPWLKVLCNKVNFIHYISFSYLPMKICVSTDEIPCSNSICFAVLGGSVRCVYDLWSGGCGFDPRRVQQQSFHRDWSCNIFYGHSLPQLFSKPQHNQSINLISTFTFNNLAEIVFFFCMNELIFKFSYTVKVLLLLPIFQVLRSDEGKKLRFQHQEAVRYLREKLVEEGIPALHCPSHIIPIHVSLLNFCW